MNTRKTFVALSIAAVFLSAGQLRAQDADAATEAPAEVPAATEPINFRDLKAWLPEKIAGIDRTDAEGSRQSMGEMKFSTAIGTFEAEAKSSTITVMDYGAIPGFIQGAAFWMNMDMDNESDSEYSKTVKLGDYKAIQTYNFDSKAGTLQVAVANRLIVMFETRDMSDDEFKAGVNELAAKLDALAALAK